MGFQTQVTLTMRELDRLKVIQAVVDRELRATQAAERLQMSARQIQPRSFPTRPPQRKFPTRDTASGGPLV